MAKGDPLRTDVVIGGAGFAGLALAIALRQGLGDPFTVAVIDPTLAHAQSKDPRASAIAAAARRLFEAIEVWDAVAAKAQPILDMVVTNSKLDDAVRPTFLTFGGEVEEGEPFAHMVENRHLVDVLVAKAKEFGVDLRAGAVTGFEKAGNAIEVALSDKNVISTRLLVGADGAHSLIREQAGIADPWVELRSVGDRDHGRRTSASTMAAPKNISFQRVRLRFCHSPANAVQSSGPKARARLSVSLLCRMTNSIASSRNASACSSASWR